uniref:Uncharacterized protein n=1 Tax=viral metagenome TaxID=1070528 RepID=A0A6C0H9L5_9ZZZZ
MKIIKKLYRNMFIYCYFQRNYKNFKKNKLRSTKIFNLKFK